MNAFRLGEDETLDDYGSGVVVWPYRRSTGDFSAEIRLHNLPFNLSLLHFEVEGRDGVRYLGLRQSLRDRSIFQRLWSRADLSRAQPIRQEDAYVGPLTEIFDHQDVLAIHGPAAEFRVEISSGGDTIRYHDLLGSIDLRYHRLGAGIRMLCPGTQEDVAFASEHFRVVGTVLGEEMKGLGAFESIYCTPGARYFSGKVVRLLEKNFFHFGNLYEDGSFDYGHYCHGSGDFNWGYVVMNGRFYAENRNTSWLPTHQNGLLQSASFALGGERWKWETTGVVPDVLKGTPISSILGRVVHLGATLPPVFSWGWMEARDPSWDLRLPIPGNV
jgi:hypothetical protein